MYSTLQSGPTQWSRTGFLCKPPWTSPGHAAHDEKVFASVSHETLATPNGQTHLRHVGCHTSGLPRAFCRPNHSIPTKAHHWNKDFALSPLPCPLTDLYQSLKAQMCAGKTLREHKKKVKKGQAKRAVEGGAVQSAVPLCAAPKDLK